MNDLINEEEFLQSKPYNPWKWFLLFYGITIGYFLCITLFKAILEENITFNIYVNLLFLITDLSLPFVMIFSKKRNMHLPYKTIIAAVTGLYVVFLSVQLIQFYLNFANNPLFPKSLFFYAVQNYIINILINIALSLLIILPIIIFKRKKAAI